mgnify:CR=1 FL=1
MIDARKGVKNARDQTKDIQQWRDKDKEYRHLNKDVKKNCRRDKRRWLEEKSKEAQEAADRNDSKTLYRIVRELTNARSGATVPIKSKDGRDLLTDEEQAERWVEHFQEVLNQPTPASLFDFNSEANPTEINISESEITSQEVRKAIGKMKNNKAAGLDEITAELLKHGKDVMVEELTQLFNLIWNSEEVPADWGQGVIMMIPKMGNLSNCNNWRAAVESLCSPLQGRHSAVFC